MTGVNMLHIATLVAGSSVNATFILATAKAINNPTTWDARTHSIQQIGVAIR